MTKNRTKIISILCTIVLLIGLIYSPRLYSSAGAGDNEILFSQVVADEGFQCVTLSDIGGNDTDKTSAADDYYLVQDENNRNNVKSLDKMAFRAYVAFNNTTGNGKGTELHLFTQDGGKKGIALTISSTTAKGLTLKRISTPGPSVNETFNVTKAGLDSISDTFNGTYFLLGLTVEFFDSDNDGDNDDMKLGVFFNDRLYNNNEDDGYITIKNASSNSNYKMGTRINFNGEAGEIYSYTTPKTLSECPEKDYDWLTLSDCGINDGSTDDKSGELPIDTLNKKLFNVRAMFKGDATSGTVLRLGATSATSDDGIAIYSKNSSDPNLYVSMSGEEKTLFLRKTNINDKSLLNQKFDLQISTEKVDEKLKLGIFINGNLYDGKFFTFEQFDSLGTFVVFDGFEGEASSIRIPITLEKSDAADFTLITLSDLGISDGSGDAKGYYAPGFDKTVLGMNIKFNGDGVRLHYANPSTSSYSGLGIRLQGKNLIVSSEAGSNEEKLLFDQLVITPEDAGLNSSTFAGYEFLLHISCEFVDYDGDSNKKDVKIGLFINGLLYKSEYLYIIDCADRMRENFNFNEAGTKIYSSIQTAPKPFPEHLKDITLTDAGLGIGSGNVSGKFQTINSLDGTLFGARLKFNKNSSRMHIGFNDNSYGGFGVRLEDGKIVVGNELGNKEGALSSIGVSVVTVDPAAVGIGETFVDKEFLLQMSFEFVDCQNDGNKNDIKFGVFVNGILCNNTYYFVKDQADLLGLGINFNEGGVALYAPYVATYADTDIDGLQKITLTDAQIGTGKGNTKGKFLALDSLNNTLFSAKVKFNINSSRLHIGTSTSDYSGFGVRLENDKLIIGNELGDKEGALSSMGLSLIVIDPKAAGVGDTFVDKEFLLQMSFEFVDRAGDGKADDIKLGVFINGKLFADTYFYLFGEADNLGLGINFSEGGAAFYAPYVETSTDTNIDSLRKITLSDARIGTGKGNAKGKFLALNSLDNTLFSAKVKFNINSSRMHIGTSTSDYSGFGVRLEKDKLVVGNELGDKEGALSSMALSFIVIDPKAAGVGDTFVDKEFLLQMSFEFVDRAGDGKADDIKFGVFIDGKLFADTYFYLFGEAKNLGLGINFSEGGAAAYASYGDVIPSGRDNYKELTPRDFMVADREYKKVSVTSVYDYTTLDGIAVTTNVKFSDDSVDQCAFYFGKAWMGARVALQSDGKLQISHLHEDGTQVMLARIDPKSVGLTTFANTSFTLRLTFDTIEAEGGYIHYRLGAYVNGQPCDSGAYLIKYTEPVTLRSAMFIYTGKSGSISIESEKSPVDFSVFGLQKETWKNTLGIN